MATHTITGHQLLKLDRPLVKTHSGIVCQVHQVEPIDGINFLIYWYGEPAAHVYSRLDFFQLVPHTGSTN